MICIHDFVSPSPNCFMLVIKGMRNSWESWEKGDSRIDYAIPSLDDIMDGDFILGANDKQLAVKLISAGKDHGKFLRQLPIIIDFTAPEYFLKEFDTYKIATVSNRTSMMHTLGKEPFKENMFSWENTPESFRSDTLDNLNALREMWIEAGKRKGPEADRWRAMVQAIPQSWNYRTVWSGNYQSLRDMYQSRHNHRLREWRQFCQWISELPYAELLTN